jgi:hypothetical protein
MINDQNNCCCCNDCNGDLKKPPQCRPRRGRKKEGWHQAARPALGGCIRVWFPVSVFLFFIFISFSLLYWLWVVKPAKQMEWPVNNWLLLLT